MALSANAQKVKDWWEGRASQIGNKNPGKFGHKDYAYVLYNQVNNQSWTGSVNAVREATLEFLRANDNEGAYLVSPNNMEGGGGLMDDLALSSNAFSLKMVYDGPGLGAHNQGEFGYIDFMHARSHGKNDREVLEWMRQNPTKITANDPGLYKHIYEVAGSPLDIPSTIDGTATIGGQPADDTTGTSPVTGQVGPVKDDEGKDVGGALYGLKDNQTQLKDIWEATKNPSEMHKHREKILDWIENEAVAGVDIADSNMKGAHNKDGLYEKIWDHRRIGGTSPGDPREPDHVKDIFDENAARIGTWAREFGELPENVDKTLFTKNDFHIAIAGGHDQFEIYRKLKDKPDWYKNNEDAFNVYKDLRNDLIQRSPIYQFSDGGGNWRKELENPLWQEVGDYINSTKELRAKYAHGKHRTWDQEDDHSRIEYFLATNFRNDDGSRKNISDFRSDADLQSVIGYYENDPGQFEPGTYWEQYGDAGPPDLPGDDQPGGRDLTWIQKMVAATGFKSRSEDNWKDALEKVENKFLDELYGSDNKWKDAPDEWGLDIMRLDAEGNRLEFEEGDGADDGEWYHTLTRGKVDWAFYQDSKIYQKAKEALGLVGEYTQTGLGIQGIREANVWVHGQMNDFIPFDSDWVQWEPENPNWKTEYKATELTITDYQPDDLKAPKTPKDISGPPTVNIPDVKIERPDNLDEKIGKIVGEE